MKQYSKLQLSATFIYCITAERGMAYRMGSNPTTADLIAIGIILLLLLEGTRRIYGMILPTVAIVFLLYCHFGRYFSGGLGHSGYSWKKSWQQRMHCPAALRRLPYLPLWSLWNPAMSFSRKISAGAMPATSALSWADIWQSSMTRKSLQKSLPLLRKTVSVCCG